MKTDKNPANTNAQPRSAILDTLNNVIDLATWPARNGKACAMLPSTHVLLTCDPTV